jgi:hypothetical protein
MDVIGSLADLLQSVFLIGGALWGLHLYLTNRRSQLRMGIEATPRLIPDWTEDKALLVVAIRMINTSGVLYRHREMTVTLMDARKEAADGTVRLAPFGQSDPLPAVYSDISHDPRDIGSGRTFVGGQTAITLEPDEYVDSEVAFVLDPSKLGLMAVRVLTMGYKGLHPEDRSRIGRAARRIKAFVTRRTPNDEPAWWGTFCFVDPERLDPIENDMTTRMEVR